MSKVCICHFDNAIYQGGALHPDTCYPEYLFGMECISREKNNAYEMVRSCLIGLGLDAANCGTEQWNPLGQYIHPGDTVVVKPNLVMHKNENPEIEGNGLECLVTNPACIRAICDYCLIALRGTGRIVIGDAPMQGCRFEELMEKTGLPKILDFYKEKGYSNISIKDFREYGALVNRNAVLVGRTYTDSEPIEVCLDGTSQHAGARSNGQYQVSDYDILDTKRYHHDTTHKYLIAKEVLEADAVINFCKPKTHRLAGFTGAMKNMVGITYNKACLPHRTRGSVEEGGDAYQHRNVFKRVADWALTEKIWQEKKKHILAATMLRYIYGAFLILGNITGKDGYFLGSWYGNDTIWRTICDLNYIVEHADKYGVVHETPQRKVLSFGDMLISGEGNGPVKPSPKHLGLMMASDDAVAFDVTLCKIMGFENSFIPLIRNILAGNTKFSYADPQVIWMKRDEIQQEKQLSETEFPASWTFRPNDAWIQRRDSVMK